MSKKFFDGESRKVTYRGREFTLRELTFAQALEKDKIAEEKGGYAANMFAIEKMFDDPEFDADAAAYLHTKVKRGDPEAREINKAYLFLSGVSDKTIAYLSIGEAVAELAKLEVKDDSEREERANAIKYLAKIFDDLKPAEDSKKPSPEEIEEDVFISPEH